MPFLTIMNLNLISFCLVCTPSYSRLVYTLSNAYNRYIRRLLIRVPGEREDESEAGEEKEIHEYVQFEMVLGNEHSISLLNVE
jgi:hypothetical protein